MLSLRVSSLNISHTTRYKIIGIIVESLENYATIKRIYYLISASGILNSLKEINNKSYFERKKAIYLLKFKQANLYR